MKVPLASVTDDIVPAAYGASDDEYTKLFGSVEDLHDLDRELFKRWAEDLDGPCDGCRLRSRPLDRVSAAARRFCSGAAWLSMESTSAKVCRHRPRAHPWRAIPSCIASEFRRAGRFPARGACMVLVDPRSPPRSARRAVRVRPVANLRGPSTRRILRGCRGAAF